MSITCRERVVDLSSPVIMGILNLTSDSFYAGSRFLDLHDILQKVDEMTAAGATFVDLGAMSSRPGARITTPDEELEILLPAIKRIRSDYNVLISVDTIHSKVAKACVGEGADIINDISSGALDSNMISTVAELGVPYIAMHMRGKPDTMQSLADYPEGVVEHVLAYFINKVKELRRKGVSDVIIDPGFGFAKTIRHNYQLLKSLKAFSILDCPVLAGLSRKSMIWKTLDIKPNEALNGTTAVNILALQNGANILRVHDVKEAAECIKIWNAYCDK